MTCAVLGNDWITLLYEGYFSLAFLPAVQTMLKLTVVMTMIVKSKEAISLQRGLRLIAVTHA